MLSRIYLLSFALLASLMADASDMSTIPYLLVDPPFPTTQNNVTVIMVNPLGCILGGNYIASIENYGVSIRHEFPFPAYGTGATCSRSVNIGLLPQGHYAIDWTEVALTQPPELWQRTIGQFGVAGVATVPTLGESASGFLALALLILAATFLRRRRA